MSRFSSRWGMMLAMLGMAVGTGNIWRFPRIAASNGGGSFLVDRLRQPLQDGDDFLAHPHLVPESQPVSGHGAICYRCHADTAAGDFSVVLD